ncbi:MAG: hypothetical protein AUK44_01750 [Porphyromonadaceae bacterium CG2_30_38_12]|nr:MAG: hypothetical protein AUK44_01750 [Porphyromonadaceae bacterium CG2_30_38_12]
MKKHFLIAIIVTLQILSLQGAIPAGYYHYAHNKAKAHLKSALKDISSPLHELEYGSGPGFTWEGFYKTDRNSDSTVIDMYSNIVRKQSSYTAVDGMHIEHSLPKSWWGAYENAAYKDLFHLYPADATTNITKSNLPLGEVAGVPALLENGRTKIGKNGFGTSYTDNCFEPADEFKGDFARSYFYISTIYEDFASLWQSPMMNNNTYPVWKPWAIELLKKWHQQDPVSAKELKRNETIYSIQNNRNPFIDYPDLVNYIWGSDTTKNFPFPNETEAFLTQPRRGIMVDFGIILTNDSRNISLHVEGFNLHGAASLTIKNSSPALNVSQSSLTESNILNGIDILLTYTPTVEGSVRDTLIISGGGLAENFNLPIKANATNDFITLEPIHTTSTSGILQWMTHPEATDYSLRLYKNEQTAGDVLISAYVEGSSWNKAVELYNGTGKTIDLSKYALRKQSNGDGAFGTLLPLSGLLLDKHTFTVVHKSANAAVLLAKANLLTDTLLQINGNDAIALTRGGLIIDMVGEANAGADKVWGLDVSLQRKSTITHPFSVFNPNDWNSLPGDSVAFIGNHTINFTIDPPETIVEINTGNVNFYEAKNLQPNTRYTYSVSAITSANKVEALNTMQLKTSTLSPPIPMGGAQITDTSFVANWESDLYATSYLLQVFRISGQADTTIQEPFNTVGSNGKPLPANWTGTASGNYTSATSSGLASPSIALKNDGEWLTTPPYTAPISKLTFMYKYASSAPNSSLLLEGLSENAWQTISTFPYKNTSKNYPVINFNTNQLFKQIRFTYNKSSGNLALDDIGITYGKSDTTYLAKDLEININFALVTNLEPATEYQYQIKSKNGTSVSDYSDAVKVKTNFATALHPTSLKTPYIFINHGIIYIESWSNNTQISIYDMRGSCIFNKNTQEQSSINIPYTRHGVFILKIQNQTVFLTKKLAY